MGRCCTGEQFLLLTFFVTKTAFNIIPALFAKVIAESEYNSSISISAKT